MPNSMAAIAKHPLEQEWMLHFARASGDYRSILVITGYFEDSVWLSRSEPVSSDAEPDDAKTA